MSWTHIVMGLTGCIQSLFIETLIDLLQCEKKINMQHIISSLGSLGKKCKTNKYI